MAVKSAPPIVDMAKVRERRDQKVSVIIRPARPAWIFDVKQIPESSTIFFDLVLRASPSGGWRRRRYEYDGEADVLHHRGEMAVPESELLTLPDEAEFKG